MQQPVLDAPALALLSATEAEAVEQARLAELKRLAFFYETLNTMEPVPPAPELTLASNAFSFVANTLSPYKSPYRGSGRKKASA